MVSNYFKRLAEQQDELFANIKTRLPALVELQEKCGSHWEYEDPIYRFYHYSYKMSWALSTALKIIKMLESLAPKDVTEFNTLFTQIRKEAEVEAEVNSDEWLKSGRAKVELLLHSKFMLDMAVKYGKELDKAPECLPSGWAALLYFYRIR
jgi:hypothetical protein